MKDTSKNNKLLTKALIIKSPWINKILDNNKTWEMRSTRTHVRGIIGLIEQGTGLIVGQAELVDCLDPLDKISSVEGLNKHQVQDFLLLEKWKYPWVLTNIKRFKTPIPYNHPQGAVIWVNLV